MANENDDDLQQNGNDSQQNDQNQQQDTGNKLPIKESLDDVVDRQLKEIDGEPRPTAGKKVIGEQQGAEGSTAQGKKPATGEQQQGKGEQQSRQVAREDQQASPASKTPRQFGNLFATNSKGDIIDGTGAVVAPQGFGRSIFHKLWPAIEVAQRERDTFKTRIENYENANKIAKDAGLSLDEQGAGLQLMSSWKKEPKKVIQTLLSLAGERGIDVTDIVQGGGGIDQSALVKNLLEQIDERLKPFSFLTQDRERQQQEAELHDQVATEYAAFIQKYPDAEAHVDAIANVMRDQQLSHTEAYFAVRATASELGLDWKKPLAPQILAKRALVDGKGGNKTPNGGGNNRKLPDFSGRGNGNNDAVRDGANESFSADMSWDAIARRVMQKHGVDVQ